MSTKVVSDEVVDNHVNNFVDRMLQCFRPCGPPADKTMRVHQAFYDPKGGVRFCSVQMCPREAGATFALDIPRAIEVFDKVDSCEMTNYEKIKGGIRRSPHLRMMGTFRGLTFMFDAHMKTVDLDK